MKQLSSLLLMLFFITTLRADEQPIPASAQDALKNHTETIKKFVNTNETELKHVGLILGNIAKILGACALTRFTYASGKNLAELTYIVRSNGHTIPTNKSCKEDWGNPHTYVPHKTTQALEIFPITRPPYFTAFAISAYLLGSGCYGLYKEVNDILKERENTIPDTKKEQSSSEVKPSVSAPTAPIAIPTIAPKTQLVTIPELTFIG